MQDWRPKGLKVNAVNNNSPPDTTLTKAKIQELHDSLEGETDREKIRAVFKTIIPAQKNEYRLREITDLYKTLDSESYNVGQIVSTLQSILMRMRPAVGGKRRKFSRRKRKTLKRK